MAHGAVHEHVCEELPVPVSVQDIPRHEGQVISQRGHQEARQAEDYEVDHHEDCGDVAVGIPETSVDYRTAHVPKILKCPASRQDSLFAHCENISQHFPAPGVHFPHDSDLARLLYIGFQTEQQFFSTSF